jgi:tetratricopeptide (TPR) repeat protein
VFGEACWDRGVARVLGEAMDAAVVGEWLARLTEQEVLIARPDSRFPDERELAFRHTLLREGAYATLTADDARVGHRRAGEWLESRGEADPMVLAGHFQRGEDRERAARYYLRAAEQALDVLDQQGALARTELGLGCDPPPELRIALLSALCQVSQRIPRVAFAEAEELMRAAPPGSVAWVQGMAAYYAFALMAGRSEELPASIASLSGVTAVPEAAGAMARLFLIAVVTLDMLGHVDQGTALEEPFLALVRERGPHELVVRFWWSFTVGMRAAYAHDDPWSALVHSEAIQPIFDVIGGEMIQVDMQITRGMNQWYLGALASAVQVLEGIPAADTAMGLANSQRRFLLAWLYADRGALDPARALATQLIESSCAHRDRMGEARGRWVLAEVLRRIGDLEGAEREIEGALTMAIPIEQPGARATLAALRLAQGRAADALAAAEDAVARSEAAGACGMFRGAFVRLVHAEALRATGAHDAARHAIARARARLLAIADKIADPGYRASFLADVPENARTLALAAAWQSDPEPSAPEPADRAGPGRS